MARFSIYCLLLAALMAVTLGQLTLTGGPGPLNSQGPGTGMGMGMGQGGGNLFSNPFQALMFSRFLDMNPFTAMLFGGLGGGGFGGNMLMPMMLMRNIW